MSAPTDSNGLPGILCDITSVSQPINRMSSAMTNVLVSPLKILSIFCWNMSPAGARSKCSLVNSVPAKLT